jgi:hypothetical protein
MRELQADKKIWEDAWLNQGYSDCAYIANTILPHAIERAIKAEIDLVDYRRGAAYMTKQIQDLEAENAKLRAVVGAARIAAAYFRTQPTIQHILVQALAELDEEGE